MLLVKYRGKYEEACECLRKDREVLLAFYDFPAEPWKHPRATNPIESTFATIRLRHRRTKGNGTRKTSLAMMFKLAQAAQTGFIDDLFTERMRNMSHKNAHRIQLLFVL